MKIIARGVISWETLEVLEEDGYEYLGPVAACKSSGSAPQPTDPYEQAAAQYVLATGTADYNAALERTGVSNPLGSSSWNITGYSGAPTTGATASTVGTPYGLGGSGVPIPGTTTSSSGDGYGIRNRRRCSPGRTSSWSRRSIIRKSPACPAARRLSRTSGARRTRLLARR